MSWIITCGMKWEDEILVRGKSGDSSSAATSAKVLPEMLEYDGMLRDAQQSKRIICFSNIYIYIETITYYKNYPERETVSSRIFLFFYYTLSAVREQKEFICLYFY